MNLPTVFNPSKWFTPASRRKDAPGAPPGAPLTRSQSEAQGPWSYLWSNYVPREVNPRFYEALREAVAPIDGALGWLVTFDGILRVDGDNTALVEEINEWMQSVQVNDKDVGFQSFYAQQGNEMYEQGFSIGQYVLAPDGTDVTKLLVADSKGIVFERIPPDQGGGLKTWYRPPRPIPHRRDGLYNVERILRNELMQDLTGWLKENDYIELDPSRLIYCSYNPENANPYGVSLMRALEFVGRILLTVQNATDRVWNRFGDPSFHVNYKTQYARVGDTNIEARRSKLATDFKTVLDTKQQGNSADFVTAVGPNDTIDVKIIGGDGQILELEMPAKHMVQNICSKTHLPDWLVGFNFGAVSGLPGKQCEMVLQDAKTRFITRKPGLKAVITAMLRARGRTWKNGDWDLVQDLPNVGDVLAEAQARFYNSEADLMDRNQSGRAGAPAAPAPGKRRRAATRKSAKSTHRHAHKEAFAEDDPELPKLEAAAEGALVDGWLIAETRCLQILGLGGAKTAKAAGDGEDDPADDGDTFMFDTTDASDLDQVEVDLVAGAAAADGELVTGMQDAYGRGVANGADELGGDQVQEIIVERNRRALADRGLSLVKDAAVRSYRDEIVQALMDGEYDGMKPDDVAAALAARFDAGEYNWRRLARTEIANAQFGGKLAQYQAHGLDKYEWIAAADACQICQDLADNGPYDLGGGPTPEDDAHPECRCTVEAVTT